MSTHILIAGGAAAVCTAVVGIAGFVIGNSRAETRARGRVYERLDEVRDDAESTYVRKDICEEKTKRMESIERKLDRLLQKNGIKEVR